MDAGTCENSQRMTGNNLRRAPLAAATALALLAGTLLAGTAPGMAQPASAPVPATKPAPAAKSAPASVAQPAGPDSMADDMANFFGQIGDHIYEDCIYELSQEQLEVQQALIEAYVKQGAPSSMARQLAVMQIQPPTPSPRCEELRNLGKGEQAAASPSPSTAPAPAVKKAPAWSTKVASAPVKTPPLPPASVLLASRRVLPQWDCAPNVDFVTIQHKGYERKLTGGEICNPFEDVVRAVPDTAKSFRLGYTITTGRLFIVSDNPQHNGRTIAWAISGREACRNNPDPDCLAARAIGPLPPGEYSFSSEKGQRVSWGPTSKRMVAGIYLSKLWYRERYSKAQTAAILARGNIAIHVRLKGEMSEACLGLEPKGWAYVSQLVRDGRATGVNVYIDEPHPQVAEKPPIVVASAFSLSSLFK